MKTRWPLKLLSGLTLAIALAQPVLAQHRGSDVRVGPLHIREGNQDSSDLVSVLQDVLVKEGETNHDVVAVLADVEVNGTVTGDLVTVLGNVKVGPSAQVKKDMVLVGGQLEAHPDAQIKGLDGPKMPLPAWLFTGIRDWVREGLLLGRPLPHRFNISWFVAGALLVFYLLITVLFPKPVQGCIELLESRPASSFLTGLLGNLLLGPLVLLLVASVVGSVLVPFLLSACGLASLFGKVVVFGYVGRHVGSQSGLKALHNPLLALITGAVLIYLLYMVPVLGFMVWGIVATLGFGAVLLGAVQTLRGEWPAPEPGQTMVAPVLIRPAGSGPVPGETPAETTYLPRAGFWIRLGATFLDLILVGALVGIFLSGFFHGKSVFLPLWIIYHLAMWTWKGTTIGGLVFGLRIVRLNGDPIRFSVALIRCLSAFFSALVLCLGFFWVGWNRERQSWHDIIAGTIIVRFPKGTPLI